MFCPPSLLSYDLFCLNNNKQHSKTSTRAISHAITVSIAASRNDDKTAERLNYRAHVAPYVTSNKVTIARKSNRDEFPKAARRKYFYWEKARRGTVSTRLIEQPALSRPAPWLSTAPVDSTGNTPLYSPLMGASRWTVPHVSMAADFPTFHHYPLRSSS